ncbi:MAG: hypothetical protein K2O32_02525 [Acetatifactor sp.]|nr:hypothetical protein [Acetatifactor sp.]
MDGQNFQNDQNNQNGQASGSTENTYSGGYQESSYQSNTYQNSNNYQSGTYQSNNYQDNTQNVYSSTYAEPAASNEGSTPGLAVASLVMGIVSIVLSCCCGVGIIFAIAGIIMAISANKQVKTGVATAGLICSIVGGVFSLIGIAYWALVFIGVAADPSLYY